MEKEVRKAVRTILLKDDKVLAIKYLAGNKKDYYDIPGGKIKNNESNFEASLREFREETGLLILNQKYIGNVIVEYPDMIFDYDVFLCNSYDGNPQNFSENNSMWIKINYLLKEKNLISFVRLFDKDIKKYFSYDNFNIKIIADNNQKILDKQILNDDFEYISIY